MIKCSDCNKEWTGTALAHCGGSTGCHETFSSVQQFDHHRQPIGKRIPTRGPVNRCVSPQELGMVKGGKGLGNHWVLRSDS